MSALDSLEALDADNKSVQKRRQEELTESRCVSDADCVTSGTVDDVDNDPLFVCHDDDVGSW